jgi:hypothetical protein
MGTVPFFALCSFTIPYSGKINIIINLTISFPSLKHFWLDFAPKSAKLVLDIVPRLKGEFPDVKKVKPSLKKAEVFYLWG